MELIDAVRTDLGKEPQLAECENDGTHDRQHAEEAAAATAQAHEKGDHGPELLGAGHLSQLATGLCDFVANVGEREMIMGGTGWSRLAGIR